MRTKRPNVVILPPSDGHVYLVEALHEAIEILWFEIVMVDRRTEVKDIDLPIIKYVHDATQDQAVLCQIENSL